jgi:hypothetical protein
MEHSKLPHSKLPWFASDGVNAGGIRNEDGFICFLKTKPFHYQGQDERYERELREWEGNCHFIATAVNEHDALKAKERLFDEMFSAIELTFHDLYDDSSTPGKWVIAKNATKAVYDKAKEIK